jgi:hypothetical protein
VYFQIPGEDRLDMSPERQPQALHAQGPSRAGAKVTDIRYGGVEFIECRSDPEQHPFARLSPGDAAGGAMKKPHTQSRLEVPDDLTER